MASAAGRVTYSGTMRGYGKVVILDHGNGLETLYAHNKKLLVNVGKRVSRGQKIATVGRTGNASTEHVHFEVRRNKGAVDPLKYLGS
jgi:murein DD-endopeptidase MepM/ murein hydrolase activator NlpD